MGMAHLAGELYHRKSFAGKISLLISGWKVLISYHLVLETVIEEYHIPLTSTAGQKSWPHTPHLPTREFTSLEKEIQTVPEPDSARSPSHNKGVLLNHVHSVQEKWESKTCYKPHISKQTWNQDERPVHCQYSPTEDQLDSQIRPQRCHLHGSNLN